MDGAVRSLKEKLLNRPGIGKYEKIYALGRGGMVPTRLLSGAMGIKKVDFLDAHYFSHVQAGSIICDDILDTGKTYFNWSSRLHNVDVLYAFLFLRKNVKDRPKILAEDAEKIEYGRGIYVKDYIVFPWESSETD